MPSKNIQRRNEYMRRYRAKRLYALKDPEKHPLRAWRKAHGLTMAATARILGTTSTSVRNYELGINPTPEWVIESIAPENADYLAKKIADEGSARIQRTEHELRTWRKVRGISQEEVAYVVGRTKKTIERWETGAKPMPAWVLKRLEEYDARLREEKNLRDRRMDQLFADAGRGLRGGEGLE